MIEPIRKTIDVGCDPNTAFAIFTEKIADWWPLDGHTVSAMSGGTAKSLVLEPKVGGEVYEITADGKREDWARVTAFEPGAKLALAWHIMAPAAEATNVEVTFTSNGPERGGGTRVDLTHSGWEIMGDAGQGSRDGYNGGWVRVFEECYGGACAA